MSASSWVDLGDGVAVDASLIDRLVVRPPWPPSHLRVRAFLEQVSWTVAVHHRSLHLCSSGTTIGSYPDEAGARAHARRVVAAMHEAAA